MKWNSDWCAVVEDLAVWSSPISASTPPCFAVPARLAWRKTSPVRSTPGPLPYHMREDAVVLALAAQLGLLRAPDRGRGEILVDAGLKRMSFCVEGCLARRNWLSRPPSGEPR